MHKVSGIDNTQLAQKGNRIFSVCLCKLPSQIRRADFQLFGKSGYREKRIGKALELLNPRAREENEQTRAEITSIVKALGKKTPYTELCAAINSLPQKRVEFSASLEILISALGDLISAKKSESFSPVFFTEASSAREAARDIPLQRLIRIFDIVMHTCRECEKNANVTLAAANMASSIKMA